MMTPDKQSLLGDFRWSDNGVFDAANTMPYFNYNGFGKYVLKRQRVIDEVFSEVQSQLKSQRGHSQSVYLSGCRGMGKTSDLLLIARELKSKGWEVYFFYSAAVIPNDAGAALTAYAKANKDQKIAVVVDEVASNPTSPFFVALLKGDLPNVLTVGAAVPRYFPTNNTANFRKVLRTADLVLNAGDEDVRCLIEFWKDKEVASPEMVDHVSAFLLDHCGGHVYPVLAFMEHFFTSPEAKEALTDEKKFRRRFFSEEFTKSAVYRDVCSRCFDGSSIEAESAEALARVLGGRPKSSDINTVSRLGWWDVMQCDVLSALLMNVHLQHIKPSHIKPVTLDVTCSAEQNLENVIIEGLNALEPHELTCNTNASGWPVENALSFNWGSKVKARITNVHLEFQKPIGRKLLDFYVNGSIDAGLEVLRNATQTVKEGSKETSRDIDEHLRRFVSKVYNVDRFALLNFAMDGQKIVLPRDAAYHDKVYTYQHSTNCLYRGEKPIRAPAVAKLPCPAPINKSGGGKRHYCTTVARRLTAARPVAGSLLPSVVVREFARLFKKF